MILPTPPPTTFYHKHRKLADKLYRESVLKVGLFLVALRAAFCNCPDNTRDSTCESESTAASLLVSALSSPRAWTRSTRKGSSQNMRKVERLRAGAGRAAWTESSNEAGQARFSAPLSKKWEMESGLFLFPANMGPCSEFPPTLCPRDTGCPVTWSRVRRETAGGG